VRRRRSRWILVSVIALTVLLAMVVRQRGAKAAPLDPSLILNVRRGALRVDVFDTGKVQPREKVELKSKVAGQVASINVDEGAKVRKGDVLLVLDPTDHSREVAKARADVVQARNSVAFAELWVERAKRALASGIGHANEVDDKKHELRARQASLQTALVSLSAAEDRFRYTKIVAPMDGTVIQRAIEPGEVVTPGVQSTFDGKALLTIADLSTLVVKVNLNQIDVAKIALGRHAEVTLDALPGQVYGATITKIAPASSKPSGKDLDVFPVEVLLDAADARIKPGMTADVRIELDSKASVLVVPLEAVNKDGATSYVNRIIEDGKRGAKTTRVDVKIGARNEREVEVLSGVSEGDRILVKPPSAEANETKL
jgi:membrane fusion protein, macrolide-specific efflux system